MEQGLVLGTLDVLVLRALRVAPSHGYAIARWIRERTDGAILVEDRALYVALRRLEREGWVTARWVRTDRNRRAREYSLTPTGRAAFQRKQAAWTAYTQAVARVLRPA